MKQSFLDSLKGLSQAAAKKLVKDAGHEAYAVPYGMVITMIARPNTVILWLNKNGNVKSARAGDPLEAN